MTHFEILVEDSSGEVLLEALLPKILGKNGHSHTWRTHAYRGIGRIPKDLRGKTDPRKRIILDQLPRILAGYGRSLQGTNSAVVVVVDLDDRDCSEFKRELLQIQNQCRPKPKVLFRIAIEEMESWLLGDKKAIAKAFPKAKTNILQSYHQDSICGTWETLADAVFPGGSPPLKAVGYPRVGEEKHNWSARIGPHIDVESNLSPSFQVFKSGLLRLAGADD